MLQNISFKVTPIIFNAISNAIQSLFLALIFFVIYRVIIARLGLEAIGIWAVVLATTSISRLADFGFSSAVTKFVASNIALKNYEKTAHIIETSLFSVCIFGFIFLLLTYTPIKFLLLHIFDQKNYEVAIELLPFSLTSLWLFMMSSIITSALDGFQKIPQRVCFVVFGQLLMALISFIFLSSMGLKALGLGQVAQGVFLNIIPWIYLRKILNYQFFSPFRFTRNIFREIFSYGANVQFANLIMMLFDPLTKILLAKFSGPSLAGVFEVANQIIIRARALIISANQVIIPKVASVIEFTPARITSLYRKNISLLLGITLMFYSVLFIWADFIFKLVLNVSDHRFFFIFYILLLGWFINTLATAAYFFNLGIGDVKLNSVTHFFMAAINFIFAPIFGYYFLWQGLLFVYFMSLSSASLYLIFIFHSKHKIHFKSLELSEHKSKILLSLSALIIFSILDIFHFLDNFSILLVITLFTSLAILYINFPKKILKINEFF